MCTQIWDIYGRAFGYHAKNAHAVAKSYEFNIDKCDITEFPETLRSCVTAVQREYHLKQKRKNSLVTSCGLV